MFVAFYGYSCPQIYILANVLTGVCSIIIEFQPTYYQRKYVLRNHEKCGYPRTLTPANKNDSLYQTFVTIHPDYSSNTKNRFNALKFWSAFISKMLLKVNLWSLLCLKHWCNITEGVWEFSTNFISNTRCSFNQSSFWLCTCEPAYQK